jgi:outer membrane protein assembly factor BamB
LKRVPNVLRVALAALAPLLLALGAVSAPSEEWPRWRGPRGDGTWLGPVLPEKWPSSGLRRLWRQAVGGGYAGVVVAAGRVYTMDHQTEPGEVERVLCFEAVTGRLLWSDTYAVRYDKLDYGSGPRAAPTVFDGRVYTLGALGHVRCLDATTGRVLWTKDMVAAERARVPTWGFAASPLIVDDLVVVHTGAEPDGSLIAFDRRSGAKRWQSLPDPAGYATPILIEHRGRRQLVQWTPEHVRSVDPLTGRPFWAVPYKVTYGVAIATPIFQEGIVFVTGYWEGSKAIRLGEQPADATLAWEDNRALRGLMSQPLYRRGHVYTIDKQFGLTCIELRTGRKLWDDGNRMTPKGRNPQASMVWLGTTERVIVLNSDGDLILARFTPDGYREDSRTTIIRPTAKNAVWAHPAYAGSRVFARNDEEIVCYSLLEPANEPTPR